MRQVNEPVVFVNWQEVGRRCERLGMSVIAALYALANRRPGTDGVRHRLLRTSVAVGEASRLVRNTPANARGSGSCRRLVPVTRPSTAAHTRMVSNLDRVRTVHGVAHLAASERSTCERDAPVFRTSTGT